MSLSISRLKTISNTMTRSSYQGPADIVASSPPVSKAALVGWIAGGIMMFGGLLNITAGKDSDLGEFSDMAQGMKQTIGMAYLAAGLNTCLIATICQHTKHKE